MMNSSIEFEVDHLLARAEKFKQQENFSAAASCYKDILSFRPEHIDARRRLARLQFDAGEYSDAVELVRQTIQLQPDLALLYIDLALIYESIGLITDAIDCLKTSLAKESDDPFVWLLLGRLEKRIGNSHGVMKSWYRAIHLAQGEGLWLDESSTPPELIPLVTEAVSVVRKKRRELFFNSFDELRVKFGHDALRRVEKSLMAYLGEIDFHSSDQRQNPQKFFFLDLPVEPYAKIDQFDWIEKLNDSFVDIKSEAMSEFVAAGSFDEYFSPSAGKDSAHYVSKKGAWEAYFFYRHGKRYDVNHASCPKTSSVLNSIDLCRIKDQGPEVCFSVLKPGTHLLPHYGATNIRYVAHLPLSVPQDCALNLIDVGEHQFRENKIVIFDDTYQHEAWNRSSEVRINLLMDCWNPHLTEVERLALTNLMISIADLRAVANQ